MTIKPLNMPTCTYWFGCRAWEHGNWTKRQSYSAAANNAKR